MSSYFRLPYVIYKISYKYDVCIKWREMLVKAALNVNQHFVIKNCFIREKTNYI